MKHFYLKVLITAIVLINFGRSLSQTSGAAASSAKKTDSLMAVLKKSAHDTGKVNILNELATWLTDEQYEQALKFADSAKKLSIELNYIKGLRNAYYILGNIHTNYTLNFDKGIDCFTSSLKLTGESDWKRRQILYSKLAFINKRQNNFTKSIEYYNTAIRSAEEHNDVSGLVNYHSYLAEIYETTQNMPLTMQHFRKILELEKISNCENPGPIALVSIAHYYILQKQYSLSETYYSKALACAEKKRAQRNEKRSPVQVFKTEC